MVNIYFGMIGALWRRWYGGQLESVPILKERGLQSVIGIMLMTVKLTENFQWYIALIVSVYIMFVFWSKGHGPIFDLGGDKKLSKSTLERYKEMWGFSLMCKLFPLKYHYKTFFDYVLMIIRYTLPLIPLIYYNYWLGFAGLLIATSYLLCWKFLPKYQTKVAELFSGFILFYIL